MMGSAKIRLFLLIGALTVSMFMVSCAGSQGTSAVQPKTSAKKETSVKPATSEKAADVKGMVRLDASFNNQIILLGYTVTPDKMLKPGQECTLTWYWNVKTPLTGEWKRFVHVTSDGDNILQNIQGFGDVAKSNSPHKWKAGQTVVDKMVFTLKKEITAPKITIVCGLYDEDGRLEILKGKSNGRDAAIGPVLETGAK
jgi:hypothetical protein